MQRNMLDWFSLLKGMEKLILKRTYYPDGRILKWTFLEIARECLN